MDKLRQNLFLADLSKVAGVRGPLADAVGGSSHNLHDALGDSEAIASIIRDRKLTIKHFTSKTESFESLRSRKQNPLLQADLVTPALAAKMGTLITCDQYLRFTQEEAAEWLKGLGAKGRQLKSCLEKRNVYAPHV